jgi:hypothetical protein
MGPPMKHASWSLQRGDTWLCLLAWLVALALLAGDGVSGITIAGWVAALGYAAALWKWQIGSRWRLAAGYCLVCAGYLGSTAVVEALRVPIRNTSLLALDRGLFEETPAVPLSAFHAPWVGEVLSASYLSYMVYLHVALCSAWMMDTEARARWTHPVWGAFAVGLVGYFVCPASGPNRAFPELFPSPLAGGVILRSNEFLNAAASARYDAFPSLHVLVTLTLLRMDWREKRWRFWTMLGPSLVMIASTLALRLHYAVDLLASAILFALLCVFWRRDPAERLSR